jgi:hypothetical protein
MLSKQAPHLQGIILGGIGLHVGFHVGLQIGRSIAIRISDLKG